MRTVKFATSGKWSNPVYAALDTENPMTDENPMGAFQIGGCICENGTKLVFTTLKEFQDFIKHPHKLLGIKARKNVRFWFHNLKYDTALIAMPGIDILQRDGRIFKLDINPEKSKTSDRGHGKIEVYDTCNFFVQKLDTLGSQIFGKEDDGHQLEDLEKRVLIDCDTCLKLALLIREQAHSRGISVPLTAASLAWNTFKSMNSEWVFNLDETPENFIRESYKGGHTENFGFGTFEGKIHCLDVNSLYPYVMRNYLPNPSKRVMTRDLKALECWNKNKRGFYRALVEVPDMMYPPLGITNAEGKYVFSTGKFWGVWTSEELHYAETLGVKILNIKQALTFSDFRPFMRSYVDKFYEDKKNATNPGIKAIAKLYLNSLYGKSAQSSDVYLDDTEVDNTISIVSAEKIVKELKHYDILSFNQGDNVYMVRPKKIGETKKVYSRNSLPEWASWITSLARIVLHKGIMAEYNAGNRVLYCDTDSIFVLEDKVDPTTVIDVDSSKLGAWSSDFKGSDYATKMEIFGNKFYYCYNDGRLIKQATKGVPSRAQLISNDEHGLTFTFVKPVNAFREWSLDGNLLWNTYTKTIDYMNNQKRIIPKYSGKYCMTLPKENIEDDVI